MGWVERLGRKLSPLYDIIPLSEYRRLKRLPRYEPGSSTLFGRKAEFSDAHGFLHSLDEIFAKQVYRFKASSDQPLIIDAGASYGLSILYFKRMYPSCRVIAFEPDPVIFGILQSNMSSWGLDNVVLFQAAAWTEETELTFFIERSLAGSLEVDFADRAVTTKVCAKRLKTTLGQSTIDFLKIDIEGAENVVLFDIEGELARVDNLFFEYHSIPGRPQRLGDLLNLASNAGFRYVISDAHGPKFPFVEQHVPGFDCQLNVSCYRARN